MTDLRHWLTRKITRTHLYEFLEQHRTNALTLEIGASFVSRPDLFPKMLKTDIRYLPVIDLRCDAHHLPFVSNSVPVILCTEVLEHCHAPQQVISEFFRVLQPGGKLILTTRFIFPLHDVPHDYFRYTLYGLVHLMKSFERVDILSEARTAETMGVLFQRMAYQATWRIPLTKLALFLMAKLMLLFQRTLAAEFGDINRATPEHDILASGYYVVAYKPQESA
jgi:SAM-dependent methyltransferase